MINYKNLVQLPVRAQWNLPPPRGQLVKLEQVLALTPSPKLMSSPLLAKWAHSVFKILLLLILFNKLLWHNNLRQFQR